MTRHRRTMGRVRGDMEDSMRPAILGCAGIALMWLLGIAGTVALVWAAIQYGIPWVIDVVMDAVEDRQ